MNEFTNLAILGIGVSVLVALFFGFALFVIRWNSKEVEPTKLQVKVKKCSPDDSVNTFVDACFGASSNAGWWGEFEQTDGVPYDVTEVRKGTRFGKALVAQKLCLIHSEISEAMEGHRKNLMDDKLPHRPMIEVELADAMIRIGDLAGALDLDLGGAICEKMAFNAVRPDHKPENRAATGGKAY